MDGSYLQYVTTPASLATINIVINEIYVTLRNHLFKWSSDFKSGSPLTLSDHTIMVGGFRHCGTGDKTFLICHVIPQDHGIKW